MPYYSLLMTHFSVDSDQVVAATASINQTLAKVVADHDLLLGQLTSLQSSWTGSAASSFQELVVRWRQTSSTVENQLAEIAAALALAASQYVDIEMSNQRLFI